MRRKESSHCYGNGQLKSLEINLDTDEWRLNGMRHVEEGQRQCSQSMGMGMTWLTGWVLPALPALCCADAWEIGDTNRDSTRTLGLNTSRYKMTCGEYMKWWALQCCAERSDIRSKIAKMAVTMNDTRSGQLVPSIPSLPPLRTFCFENPGSTTNTIPSIVREVSAMFVLTTSFRPGGPDGCLGGGASLNMSCCSLGGREEYRGYTHRGPHMSPVNQYTASQGWDWERGSGRERIRGYR